jgi:4-hydroxy-tetrahydrodipicolinate reductase
MATRIGIVGIQGRMGGEIVALATRDPEVALVGGVSRSPDGARFPALLVTDDPSALLPAIDALVDFSTAGAVEAVASACVAAGTPLVTGTSGLDAAQQAALQDAARQIPVFQAANMSPGINAMLAVLPALVRALEGYDLEIVEAHHRYKADAPSGTAIALGRAIAEASGGTLEERARHGREGFNPRQPGEIGIHAVRSGGNVGEHTVILAGDGEEIRLSHRAFNRASYAEGALRAAKLIVGQPAGFYGPATLPGFL